MGKGGEKERVGGREGEWEREGVGKGGGRGWKGEEELEGGGDRWGREGREEEWSVGWRGRERERRDGNTPTHFSFMDKG